MRWRSAPTVLFLLYGAFFFAGLAFFGLGVRRATAAARAEYNAGRTDAALGERNSSAFAHILDEFRSTMADTMFVKTNRYLHGGVAYAPRLKMDSADDSQAYAGCTPGTPTLVRPATSDFRGFLGDLERQVKPFRAAGETHIHMTADELTPWFRMMTLVNPNYIRGYRIGAKTLAEDKKWSQALDFLNEGIANNQGNPELFLLYQSLASFHMRGRYHRGYPWGETWVQKGLDAATKAYELGLKQRPPLGEVDKTAGNLAWTSDLEEDFRYSAHMIPLLLREQGKPSEALVKAQEIQAVIPSFMPLKNTIRQLGKETKGQPAK
jgi:hypothetical protein